jgi:hypothetical protein
MGAWDSGPFQNDSAGDWLDDAVAAGGAVAVERALRAAAASPPYLEVDEGSSAVAAVAVLVAALTGDPSDLPDDARELVDGWIPDPSLVPLAAAALDVVAGGHSELASLWGQDPDWRASIGRLRAALRPPS